MDGLCCSPYSVARQYQGLSLARLGSGLPASPIGGLSVRLGQTFRTVLSNRKPGNVGSYGVCPPLALFGPRAMSDLGPDCAPKRTSASATGTLRKTTEMTDPIVAHSPIATSSSATVDRASLTTTWR